jgi:protein arginine kinase
MTIDELTRNRSAWLRADMPMADIVISSRIRLARNVAGFPFLPKADSVQRREIHRLLREGIDHAHVADDLTFIDLEGVDEIDRQVLVERHLISRQLAEGEGSRAVAFGKEETVSLMINEEDHLRMQVLRSGLQMDECWAVISRIDNAIEHHIDFAFHARFGYLTACPTNVGTGIRVSAMLHLPALKLTGEMERAFRAAKDMHLAIRGLHGEGSEATGDLYQISNQTTLGKSEEEIISEFKHLIIPKLVEYEKKARQSLQRERSTALDDKVWRAYGLLTQARTVSTEEALALLSHVRMGVSLGRIDSLKLETLNDLFLMIQPAHLQKLAGKKLGGEERSVARADLIRQRLTSVSAN